jgi:hypothetical protein
MCLFNKQKRNVSYTVDSSHTHQTVDNGIIVELLGKILSPNIDFTAVYG